MPTIYLTALITHLLTNEKTEINGSVKPKESTRKIALDKGKVDFNIITTLSLKVSRTSMNQNCPEKLKKFLKASTQPAANSSSLIHQ